MKATEVPDMREDIIESIYIGFADMTGRVIYEIKEKVQSSGIRLLTARMLISIFGMLFHGIDII